VTDEEFPDIFADGVTVSSGTYGMAFTFLLSDPFAPPAAGSLPGRIVARVRVSAELAEALADNIKRGVASLPDRRKESDE
jgi:hypothetical protein